MPDRGGHGKSICVRGGEVRPKHCGQLEKTLFVALSEFNLWCVSQSALRESGWGRSPGEVKHLWGWWGARPETSKDLCPAHRLSATWQWYVLLLHWFTSHIRTKCHLWSSSPSGFKSLSLVSQHNVQIVTSSFLDSERWNFYAGPAAHLLLSVAIQ